MANMLAWASCPKELQMSRFVKANGINAKRLKDIFSVFAPILVVSA